MTIDSFIEDEKVNVNQSQIFPCPSCGANMNFNPENQSLCCEYCGNLLEIATTSGDIKEYDLEEGLSQCSSDWGSEVRVIRCDNCGAETILEYHNTALRCAFCDSSHVVNIDEVPGIPPESLVPFKVSSTKAKESFSKWLKGKFFAPKDLKNQHKLNSLAGVYIPYWTYDTDTYSVFHGEKGTYYYVNQTYTTTVNGKRVTRTRRVRRTRWEPTNGIYGKFFDDELIHGSNQLDSLMLGDLGTFNLKELVEYKPEYLSGFVAEKYSIGLKDCWIRAKDRIKNKIRQGIVRQINGDEVRNLNINTSYDKITYKHILLPIWISAYTYKGKNYRFMINGQTGEIQGKAPISIPKIIGVIIISATLIGVAIKLFAS